MWTFGMGIRHLAGLMPFKCYLFKISVINNNKGICIIREKN